MLEVLMVEATDWLAAGPAGSDMGIRAAKAVWVSGKVVKEPKVG